MPEIKIVLNNLLKERNMTQTDLVRMTGIRSEAISNIVRGKIERLSLDHLQKIMTALDITDVGEILKYITVPATEESIEPVIEKEYDPLEEHIFILDLPTRITNVFRKPGFPRIYTIRDLIDAESSSYPISSYPGIGPGSLKLINEKIDEFLKGNQSTEGK